MLASTFLNSFDFIKTKTYYILEQESNYKL